MKIRSIAHALPSCEVTNQQLIELVLRETRERNPDGGVEGLGQSLAGLLEHAGAVTRYHRAPGERSFEFGVSAARRALQQADLGPEAIDLLIYVGVGRGFLEPATANVFQEALQLSGATCFDILDACASWMRGLDVAHHMLLGGNYQTAMILNCEFNFREYIDLSVGSLEELQHLWAGFTIGEAATATIIGRRTKGDGYHASFRSESQRHRLCQIPLPHVDQFNGRLEGQNHRALRFYAHAGPLHGHAAELLERHYRGDKRISGRRHDIIFGHSASARSSLKVLARMDLDPVRHVEIFPRHGNTVSASIPLAMSLAHDDGRLKRGQRVLMIMGSAGLSSGFCSLEF